MNNKVKFKIILKRNEDYTSVTYGCIKFNDSYRFLSSSIGELVKNFDDDLKVLNKEFPDHWET